MRPTILRVKKYRPIKKRKFHRTQDPVKIHTPDKKAEANSLKTYDLSMRIKYKPLVTVWTLHDHPPFKDLGSCINTRLSWPSWGDDHTIDRF